MKLERPRRFGWVPAAMAILACGGTATPGDTGGDGGAVGLQGGESGAVGGSVTASGGRDAAAAAGGSPGGGTFAEGGAVASGGDPSGGSESITGGLASTCVSLVYPVAKAATDCTYTMPPFNPDIPIDYYLATLTYYPAGMDPVSDPQSGVALNLRIDQGEPDPTCGAAGSDGAVGTGWYYSKRGEAQEPLELTLCPVTCDLVRADPNAQMTITFACSCVC